MKKQLKRRDRPGVDRYGRTELHYAALDGDAEKIAELIVQGISPGAPDDDGRTPLHAAVQGGFFSACVALLEAGAPVNVRDANGNTPLSIAVFESRGRGDIIKLLRDHGADPRLANNHGVSPLKLALTIANFNVRQFFDDLPVDDAN
jgi:ankyrin repeat protein